MEETKRDEILEQAWIKREEGTLTIDGLLVCTETKITKEDIEEMERCGFLSIKDDKVLLTSEGEKRASEIIRSHRLAERLFTDVLELKSPDMESNACTFEHYLSLEVTESICTLLGHPVECPHGKPIPQGECCRRAKRKLESVIASLAELKSGTKVKVAYIATKHHSRLDKLTAMGIIPGATITVHQTFPSYVIKIGETQIALDKEALRDIYVRRR
ncbi:MAG: metal-dependent transcriptional regulator [Candidatus Omnitrophota bacterium]